MRHTLQLSPLFLAAVSFAGPDPSLPPTFLERNGIVAIEAEHFSANVGPWEEVEGRSAMARASGMSPDFRLTVVDAGSPLAAGCSGEIELPRSGMVPWVMTGRNADVAVAAGHDARKAVVFAYEGGTALPSGTAAPADRVFVPMPSTALPPAEAWLAAAATWAARGLESPSAVLLLNQDEPTTAEAQVRVLLERAGLLVATLPARDASAETLAAHGILVVPATVRAEKVEGRFRNLDRPIMIVGKHELAEDLGLAVAPAEMPTGANAMLIRGGAWTDHLRYDVHFERAGAYRVWLLGQSGGTGGSDEVKVFFDRNPDPAAAEFFEMRFGAQPGWYSEAFARRPENRKTPVPAVLEVGTPGWHTLYLVRGSEPEYHTPEPPKALRFPNWRVDRIVLLPHEAVSPAGDGPPETRNDGSIAPPAGLPPDTEWRPRQTWSVRDGYAVIEAEAIDHSALWVERTDPAGFTGRAFLEWRGPDLTRSIEGLGGNNDQLHIRQGAPEHWLILRLRVETPGTHLLDVRNIHAHKDGDNDAWVARMGARGTPGKPIGRLGDSHGDGTGFTWLDWGVHRLELTAGLNEYYIGGRSIGFGIDRLAVYREGDEEAKARALDPATPSQAPLP